MKPERFPSMPRRSPDFEQHKLHVLRDAQALEREARREEFFEFFVTTKMLSRFEDDLDDLDLEGSVIEHIASAAVGMSFKQLYAALSYPHDLRSTFLSRILSRVSSGEIKPEEVLPQMAEINTKHGFSIGFHMSKYDIQPTPKGWAVIGKEIDHRDNDLPMAYYARTFKNLFRRKLSNFMYIVRAEDSHKVSDDDKWSRASTLSIVQQIPMDELRKGLEQLEREMQEVAKQADPPANAQTP